MSHQIKISQTQLRLGLYVLVWPLLEKAPGIGNLSRVWVEPGPHPAVTHLRCQM